MLGKQIKKSEGCLSLIAKMFGIRLEADSATTLPYGRRDSILSRAEHDFYTALQQALESRAVIAPKVGLQDIFSIIDREHYQAARNRISTRHIDFLVCETGTLRPLFGIELDDRSHAKPKAQERDDFKDMVFDAAMLPLVRFPVKGTFKAEEIKNKLQPFFKQENKAEAVPLCPNCKIPMIRRTARHGERKGQDFWACSNYPTCKELINIESNSVTV